MITPSDKEAAMKELADQQTNAIELHRSRPSGLPPDGLPPLESPPDGSPPGPGGSPLGPLGLSEADKLAIDFYRLHQAFAILGLFMGAQSIEAAAHHHTIQDLQTIGWIKPAKISRNTYGYEPAGALAAELGVRK